MFSHLIIWKTYTGGKNFTYQQSNLHNFPYWYSLFLILIFFKENTVSDSWDYKKIIE